MSDKKEEKTVVEKTRKPYATDIKKSFKSAFAETGADKSSQIPPSKYRHPKEHFYFMIAAITGGVVWGLLALAIMVHPPMIITFAFLGLMLFIMLRLMKAMFFGNALNVNQKQCPEIYKEVQTSAQKLGIKNLPYIFVVNGDGMLNAMAIRLVGKGYVVLMGNLVDHYLRDGNQKELLFVINHELAHHAAGHTALWKVLLTGIASWIPFLGKAYGRACEYTCDRAGVLAVADLSAAKKAIISLAHGSEALKGQINTDAFVEQDSHIPGFFGFLLEINYSHPRLTRRVAAINDFMPK